MKFVLTFMSALALSFTAVVNGAASEKTQPGYKASSIYWSDADSGRIDGERFRLYGVDAPETGGVGAWGGAKCELERERGYDAKAYIVELTRDADLVVTATYGFDDMPEPRLLIELSADGKDLSEKGIAEGHLAPWPHDGTKALAPKPDWCQP